MNSKSPNIILSLMIAAITACGLLMACAGGPPEEKIVTVSIEPQKFLLEQITGDRIQVRCLLSDGANPETYDPSMTHMLNLEKSVGYLRMGNIGFEAALLDKIHEANPSLPIYNTSRGIVPVTGTHSHGGVTHDVPDPHTWTSVKNARIILRNMLEAMVEIDPGNSRYYEKNYNRYAATLDSLDAAITSRLAPYRGMAFMVWHPSLSYLARDYGLEQIVIGSADHKEVSIPHLRTTIEHARDHGANLFFHQKGFDSRQVSAINSGLEAREVSINPLSYDWENEITAITDAIAECGSSSMTVKDHPHSDQ